ARLQGSRSGLAAEGKRWHYCFFSFSRSLTFSSLALSSLVRSPFSCLFPPFGRALLIEPVRVKSQTLSASWTSAFRSVSGSEEFFSGMRSGSLGSSNVWRFFAVATVTRYPPAWAPSPGLYVERL